MPAPPARFLLRDVAVLDAGGGFADGLDVAVADGRVVAVGPALDADDAASIDCSGLFLMPGVIDTHVHLGWSSYDTLAQLSTSIQRWTLEAAAVARRTLHAGVTTVRDAGGIDAGFRDALAAGTVPGPDVQASIVLLSQTGGHGDGYLPGPALEATAQYLVPDYPGRPPVLVDGPDAMRRAVRETLRAGADWIKLCTTGGVLSPHDSPTSAELSGEEVAIAVAEAQRRGRGVMCHAYGGEGVDIAVAAGVRSIEHGTFLTEQQAAAMARAGCWLVPTLLVIGDAIRWGREGLLPDYAQAKARTLEATFGDAVRIAREHGVPIALGTDALHATLHGRNLEEIALLCDGGMPFAEALLCATTRGAQLLGLADEVGRIAPGYRFDALLLDEEPTSETFRRGGAVSGVFKDGVPVVAHERLDVRQAEGAP